MSAGNLPVVHVIREALESVLDPEVAAAVFFESLNGPGGVPETKEEVLLMVRGPLYAALIARVGNDESNEVVDNILATLEPAAGTAGRRGREEDATVALRRETAPVPVRILAAGAGFATRLRYALGPARVDASHVTNLDALRGEAGLAIVVVDATDFLPVDPAVLVRSLSTLPPDVTLAVWAAELPFGQRFQEALTAADVEAAMIERAEGIDPLLDLILSRRA